MTDDMESQIKAIIAEVLELDPQKVDALGVVQQVLQVDSVAFLEILVKIERKFNIDIQEKDLQGLTRLDELLALIQRKLADRPGH